MKERFPFVSEEYIQFIESTDGADIAQCRLYGSQEYPSGVENYLDTYPESIWLPFGHESGGDPLLLHYSGKVAIGYGKSNSGESELLADNFSDFLGEVLMGSRFPSIFRLKSEEFTEFINEEADEDSWLTFLLDQKWISRNA